MTLTVQYILIAIIGLAVVLYVGLKLYRMAKSKGRSSCNGCCYCPHGKNSCH